MYKTHADQLAAQRRWYIKNKQEILRKKKERCEIKKVYFGQVKINSGCVVCGERELCCLDFHHKKGTIKSDNISNMVKNRKTDEEILKEIEKCVVLCSNCHRKVHAGLIKL